MQRFPYRRLSKWKFIGHARAQCQRKKKKEGPSSALPSMSELFFWPPPPSSTVFLFFFFLKKKSLFLLFLPAQKFLSEHHHHQLFFLLSTQANLFYLIIWWGQENLFATSKPQASKLNIWGSCKSLTIFFIFLFFFSSLLFKSFFTTKTPRVTIKFPETNFFCWRFDFFFLFFEALQTFIDENAKLNSCPS